ncbi:hypothetical protein [Micromonospora sp. NPDC005172]|uniref:hypothetical protein n=1 Tax=Micromonospora sp. NPDC005172 TaxID=3156867 RepID=UPI0033A5ADF3
MSFWEFVTRVGVPLIVVVGAAVIAVGAFTDPPETFSWPRGWQWAWVGLWLMASGEAAFGTERPWSERVWKGAAALLVAVASLVAVWRHQRWRRRAGRTDGDPAP